MNSFVYVLDEENEINITWIITNQCNLNCSYCVFKHTIQSKSDITKEKFNQQLEFIKSLPYNAVLTLFGGEPTLHPYIFELTTECKQQVKSVDIITNGTNLDIIEKLNIPCIISVHINRYNNLNNIIDFCKDYKNHTIKLMTDGKVDLLKSIEACNKHNLNFEISPLNGIVDLRYVETKSSKAKIIHNNKIIEFDADLCRLVNTKHCMCYIDIINVDFNFNLNTPCPIAKAKELKIVKKICTKSRCPISCGSNFKKILRPQKILEYLF